jgi:hypothetical protein
VDRIATASALEVSRPKTSGPAVNVHIVRVQRFEGPDYEKMREQIQNRRWVEKNSVASQEK